MAASKFFCHSLLFYAYAKIKILNKKLVIAIESKKSKNGGTMSRSITALDVANWFVARANREKAESFGEGVSNLKLQKIVYFAQAAYLVLENEPLFNDEIYAWNYGPVVESVYHEFKSHQKTPIPKPSDDGYLKISSKVAAFLADVWELFGKYSAGKLVEMTHAHDPWKNTYDAAKKNLVIPKETIKNYYKPIFIRT